MPLEESDELPLVPESEPPEDEEPTVLLVPVSLVVVDPPSPVGEDVELALPSPAPVDPTSSGGTHVPAT